ncbi:hypothetical protein [Roseateles amylovorans]|uniref:Uncharacterized protein n=1 Tax=Roseateles amylovorans TaxID=2978473 RepID=A0ABY6AVU5_9BURK|nr:hypothetical protein [Roseateles amylovorans]UXH76987.1 hypothetical protein N4261_18435 [Roseateles amylovorans]
MSIPISRRSARAGNQRSNQRGKPTRQPPSSSVPPDSDLDDQDWMDWFLAAGLRATGGAMLGVALSGFIFPQSVARDVPSMLIGAAFMLWIARRNGSI